MNIRQGLWLFHMQIDTNVNRDERSQQARPSGFKLLHSLVFTALKICVQWSKKLSQEKLPGSLYHSSMEFFFAWWVQWPGTVLYFAWKVQRTLQKKLFRLHEMLSKMNVRQFKSSHNCIKIFYIFCLHNAIFTCRPAQFEIPQNSMAMLSKANASRTATIVHVLWWDLSTVQNKKCATLLLQLWESWAGRPTWQTLQGRRGRIKMPPSILFVREVRFRPCQQVRECKSQKIVGIFCAKAQVCVCVCVVQITFAPQIWVSIDMFFFFFCLFFFFLHFVFRWTWVVNGATDLLWCPHGVPPRLRVWARISVPGRNRIISISWTIELKHKLHPR